MSGQDVYAIAISNIPFSSPWQDVKDLVRDFSPRVTHVEIYKSPNGQSRGYGYATVVGLKDAEYVESCLDGKVWHGRSLNAKLVTHQASIPSHPAGPHYTPAPHQNPSAAASAAAACNGANGFMTTANPSYLSYQGGAEYAQQQHLLNTALSYPRIVSMFPGSPAGSDISSVSPMSSTYDVPTPTSSTEPLTPSEARSRASFSSQRSKKARKMSRSEPLIIDGSGRSRPI